jgi:hypothetical protein
VLGVAVWLGVGVAVAVVDWLGVGVAVAVVDWLGVGVAVAVGDWLGVALAVEVAVLLLAVLLPRRTAEAASAAVVPLAACA